ncbi:hypothetical protein [Nocardia terpenica]|uniref:hypothetical protein n=1 Tax=Nocardia terpenica TaxID=455432 RepID=UPI0003023522|nr:hypothetical protein [Nocardia terpenica]NQE93694.1 hypothetical protein [Nocardia terpenica]
MNGLVIVVVVAELLIVAALSLRVVSRYQHRQPTTTRPAPISDETLETARQ